MNKKKLIANFSTVLAGLVLTGIVGTSLGETFGYSHGALALFCLFGYKPLAAFVETKVK